MGVRAQPRIHHQRPQHVARGAPRRCLCRQLPERGDGRGLLPGRHVLRDRHHRWSVGHRRAVRCSWTVRDLQPLRHGRRHLGQLHRRRQPLLGGRHRRAVYVGGHQRWLDNPLGHNSAGPGAVERLGIAAIDPVSGKANSWNPGKDRNHGAERIYVTSSGIWVGSDGQYFAGESHAGIAFCPLSK